MMKKTRFVTRLILFAVTMAMPLWSSAQVSDNTFMFLRGDGTDEHPFIIDSYESRFGTVEADVQRAMEMEDQVGYPIMCFYGVGNHGGGPYGTHPYFGGNGTEHKPRLSDRQVRRTRLYPPVSQREGGAVMTIEELAELVERVEKEIHRQNYGK